MIVLYPIAFIHTRKSTFDLIKYICVYESYHTQAVQFLLNAIAKKTMRTPFVLLNSTAVPNQPVKSLYNGPHMAQSRPTMLNVHFLEEHKTLN